MSYTLFVRAIVLKGMLLSWNIEYTDEFSAWWKTLDEEEQISVDASVLLLEQCGPHLRFPHSSSIEGSKMGHLRELRVQHKGNPYRVLYAFDPTRTALLLIGGNKRGTSNWYKKLVPVAEKLYAKHLKLLKE